MFKFIFFIIVSLTTTYAREFNYIGKWYYITYEEAESKQYIYLEGKLLSGIVEDYQGLDIVISKLRSDMDIEIYLNSDGGFQPLVEDYFDKIKKNCRQADGKKTCQITTVVRNPNYCASACIIMFMAGDKRIASKNAKFGFHSAALIPGAIKIPFYAEMGLKKSGVNQGWVEKNKKLFDSINITWIKAADLNGSNIVTHLINDY